MRKYRRGIESEGSESNSNRDSNPDMRRRDFAKFLIGSGIIGGGLYFGGKQAMEYNPQTIEKWCNEIMRRNNDPRAVENIQERIARYERELEELVKDARPIRTFEELDKVRTNLRGNYKLVNDIHCPTKHNWEPIGIPEKPFTGTFNGQGFTIHNLRAEWPERDYVGMFGVVESKIDVKKNSSKKNIIDSRYLENVLIKQIFVSTISNLKIENIKVVGNFNVGKLLGINNGGFMCNCYTNGTVDGTQLVGGLVGQNLVEGILSKCINKGYVGGVKNVGGMIGCNNEGYLVCCFPNDMVSGQSNVGTLIGWNRTTTTSVDDFSEHIIRSSGTIGWDDYRDTNNKK